MPSFRWKFYDPDPDTEVEWILNPNAGGDFTREKNVDANASSQGAPIMFEGRQKPVQMTMSGVILEEAQYDFFNTWFDLDHSVRVTNDLGQVFWAYCIKFTPKRERRRSHQWAMTYDLTVLITQWGD